MVMIDLVSWLPMAQVHQLGPKVGGRLVLFCIQSMNGVNSRNDSESWWWQHHAHCPGYYYYYYYYGDL